jgi:LPS-assembly lipoprotein
MWSHETSRLRGAARRLTTGLVIAFAAAMALSGCTSVQPLYGSIDGHPNAVQAAMRQIDVELAKTRLTQVIRNELIFDLYGGEGSPDPKPAYKLSVRVNDSNTPEGFEKFVDVPSAYLEQLNASFTLVETTSQKTVLTGTSFANAAYDFSNQRFANIRAQRDAQDRAAKVIADDIHTKLAAFFAEKH